MIALIDADILCYEFGNMKDLDTGDLLAWPIVRKFVDERIELIQEAVEATSSVLYLTDSPSNFRNKVATILPYKGHRTSEKPPHWQEIRDHLVDNYDATVCYGIEADDAVGIAQSKAFWPFAHWCVGMSDEELLAWQQDFNTNTIICSRDKDLHMIPGWHYSWPCGNQKENKWFVSETDGIRFFYKQLLTGDSTDNILGLYRIGEKASCVKALDDMTEELDMYKSVLKEYEARFGAYADKFLHENAALLWIKRQDDSSLSPLAQYLEEDEISIRLDNLDNARILEERESGVD